MKPRVWYNRIKRKLHSFWVNYVLEIVTKRKNNDLSETGLSMLGHVDVLEVLVPLLVTGDMTSEIDSPALLDELRDWMTDLGESWGAGRLQFRVAEPLIHKGWDSVTGLKGRVVSLEVWGVRRGLEAVNHSIMSSLVQLNETTDEKKSEELVEKIKELMLERSKRSGNIKNLMHYEN